LEIFVCRYIKDKSFTQNLEVRLTSMGMSLIPLIHLHFRSCTAHGMKQYLLDILRVMNGDYVQIY
jgi:hypothetical protein